MLLIIDNYDSFTYNLVQGFSTLTDLIDVARNDTMTVGQVLEKNPRAIILSPGPGTPEQAGICIDLIRQAAPTIPILGVCLGHQAIGAAFGGRVVRAGTVMHGKTSTIFHKRQALFKDMPLPLAVGRYHSLVVERSSLPSELLVEADAVDGTVMALRHAEYPCYGVQFHPESILTQDGLKILGNFLELAGI